MFNQMNLADLAVIVCGSLKGAPDVLMVEPDGQTIKVDQIRQLQEEFSKSGFESRLKIFLLSQSEKMNTSAANSLLKFWKNL